MSYIACFRGLRKIFQCGSMVVSHFKIVLKKSFIAKLLHTNFFLFSFFVKKLKSQWNKSQPGFKHTVLSQQKPRPNLSEFVFLHYLRIRGNS